MRLHLGKVLGALGVVAVMAGAYVPATADPIGADPCPAGTALVAKFEVVGGSYVFEEPAGNESVVVLSGTTLDGGTWTSTTPIGAIVVKGGDGDDAVATSTYTPPATSGTFSNAGLVNQGGNVPDISFVAFCGPTSTTSSSSSTSTSTTVPQRQTTVTTATTTATTTEAVLPTQLTQLPTTPAVAPTTLPTEVEGRQLARTGGPNGFLLVLGSLLILQGGLFELAAKKAQQR